MRLVSKKYLIITSLLFWLFAGAFWFYNFLGFVLPTDSGNWYIPACGVLGIVVLVRLHNIVNKSKWQPLIAFGAVALGFIVSLSWWLSYSKADIPQPTWDTAFFVVTMMAVFFLIPMVGYVLSLPLQWKMWKVLSSGKEILQVQRSPQDYDKFVVSRLNVYQRLEYFCLIPTDTGATVTYDASAYATKFVSREHAAKTAALNGDLVIVF